MDSRDYQISRLQEQVTRLEEMLLDLAAEIRYFPLEHVNVEAYPSRSYWYKSE